MTATVLVVCELHSYQQHFVWLFFPSRHPHCIFCFVRHSTSPMWLARNRSRFDHIPPDLLVTLKNARSTFHFLVRTHKRHCCPDLFAREWCNQDTPDPTPSSPSTVDTSSTSSSPPSSLPLFTPPRKSPFAFSACRTLFVGQISRSWYSRSVVSDLGYPSFVAICSCRTGYILVVVPWHSSDCRSVDSFWYTH